jgi:hypothetical protein
LQQTDAIRPKLDPPDPPAWWPEDAPYHGLKQGFAYRDQEGRWRDHQGVVLSRKARRRAGLK